VYIQSLLYKYIRNVTVKQNDETERTSKHSLSNKWSRHKQFSCPTKRKFVLIPQTLFTLMRFKPRLSAVLRQRQKNAANRYWNSCKNVLIPRVISGGGEYVGTPFSWYCRKLPERTEMPFPLLKCLSTRYGRYCEPFPAEDALYWYILHVKSQNFCEGNTPNVRSRALFCWGQASHDAWLASVPIFLFSETTTALYTQYFLCFLGLDWDFITDTYFSHISVLAQWLTTSWITLYVYNI